MANKSDWKGFEKKVANILGGKRRFRTTENYGKLADDVKFDKPARKKYPVLDTVVVECKKRKGSLPVHTFFEEAYSKYGKGGLKRIILASKLTRKQGPTLFTIDAAFFVELWTTWLLATKGTDGRLRFPRRKK